MKQHLPGVIRLSLKTEKDVFEATDTAFHLAGQTGFARLDCNLIATAVSEIAMNVVRYADTGTIKMSITDNKKGLVFDIEDEGPGIANAEQALTDGFTTTKTSLGVGMGAARRAMDTFTLNTRPGHGTRIKMEKYLPLTPGAMECGVISMPDQAYVANGDGYIIRELKGNEVLLAVIDGLGEGDNAARSTTLAKEVIETFHHLPLDTILHKCHVALREKGDPFGAAIGLMLLKPRSFQYAGVGDTFLKILRGKETAITSQQGIIGPFRMPALRVVRHACRRKDMMIALCTDGIKEHFSGKDLPLDNDVHSIARHIFTRYRREFGDATVLVARFNT